MMASAFPSTSKNGCARAGLHVPEKATAIPVTPRSAAPKETMKDTIA